MNFQTSALCIIGTSLTLSLPAMAQESIEGQIKKHPSYSEIKTKSKKIAVHNIDSSLSAKNMEAAPHTLKTALEAWSQKTQWTLKWPVDLVDIPLPTNEKLGADINEFLGRVLPQTNLAGVSIFESQKLIEISK
jgi:hypothetical protein